VGGLAVVVAAALAAPGCGSVTVEPGGAGDRCTSTVSVEAFATSWLDKVDLLFAIDNSRSMADKQLILALSIPDLVRRLVNPRCIDAAGIPAQEQPGGPLEQCPPGSRREIAPVLDIHLGVVSSSLGGHGSDSCSPNETQGCGVAGNPSNDDAGHLLSRVDACGGQMVPTYQNRGFLAWDPGQMQSPPGEKNIGAIAVGDLSSNDIHQQVVTSAPGLIGTLKDMVVGTGQVGCGYESQLESWYRFLIDPEPYKSIGIEGGKAVPSGIDDVLLKQRADFLRPSSLLAIVMLTDENDCSVKEYGQFYLAVQQRSPSDPKKGYHLPRARHECAQNPDSPCCKSCGEKAASCPPDDECAKSPNLNDAEDDINLRCFDQKRRFGIDFLYPIDRYATGLSSPTVQNRQGDLVPNPLFVDLDPTDLDSNIRDASLVFLAGIVGVPWQDIARKNANGQPDLAAGLDLTGKAVGGFQYGVELDVKGADGLSTWDRILGDPGSHVPPKDPHMIESITPRPGLAPPGAPPGADPINGHEYSIFKNDDLQYACIFDLPTARDCSGNLVSCDCSDPSNDNPLCNPANKTIQQRAKAYPGLRELSVLRAIGAQGIVSSVCPAQTGDPSKGDYGYRTALDAIIERLTPVVDGQCFPYALTPSKEGTVPCAFVEARRTNGSCACPSEQGRAPVQASHQGLVSEAQKLPLAQSAKWDCFCEIPQLEGPLLDACQTDASDAPVVAGEPVNGWCYVDATAVPPLGNPEIVKSCPPSDKRLVRFVGAGAPGNNTTVFAACELGGQCAGGGQ
jgi:hypothetical protein